jgi:DNA polymerase/3'-5' exonuclease PolX
MTINSESGKSYEINLEKVTCTCPGFIYRKSHFAIDDPERLCKHLLSVKDQLIYKKANPTWSKKGKHDRPVIESIVKDIKTFLSKYFDVDKFEFCGSYRRGNDQIGDIDVIITCDGIGLLENTDAIFERFEKYFNGFIINLVKGSQKASYAWTNKEYGNLTDVQIDLRLIPKSSYIFALMHYTGSVEENVRLRRKALSMGYSLNEYRLSDKTENMVSFFPKSEKDVYDFLEEEYKEPKNR